MANSELIAAQVVRVPTGIANCYIVGTPEAWVMIDAGTPGSAKNILRAVREHFGADAVPAAIVLTHGHFDHSGSARELAERWRVEIYAHRLELPFVNGSSRYPAPDPTVGGFMSQVIRFLPNKKMDLGHNLRQLPAGRLPWLPEWEILETPGHSPGHVSFFRGTDGTVLAGDAFATVNQNSIHDVITQRQQVAGPPPYSNCDWQAAERSMKKLAELRPRVLAAGHGIPMRGAQAAAQLRALANNFPIPDNGRYVREPARTDESGIVYLPPPVSDPVKIGALAAVGVLGLAGAGWVARSRRQRIRAQRQLEQAA
ncbi:MAG TPA: MBL fold metallo-hydrolase [Terriglobales bacterium]|nr:MBL fold metallo-hydrolase [Terriglobales bacterium]